MNLAPGGVRKTGSGLELAVALGLLAATDELPSGVLDGVAVLGELGLDGSVRAVTGTLALVDALARRGVTSVIVPLVNAAEATLVSSVEVRVARTLAELRSCLKGEAEWPACERALPDTDDDDVGSLEDPVDLREVRGLTFARRALEVAAAGGHHLLYVGPPGTGKTMLARRLPTVLPALEQAEALEVTRIHSAAGGTVGGRLLKHRPFRAPHHTASTASLVGGGSARLRPGEVTLAHRGTLFLDELGEFAPTALDALRQPLEERVVRISRQHASLTFPASFQLVACTNPCPCGLGAPDCRCTEMQRARYRRRLERAVPRPLRPPGTGDGARAARWPRRVVGVGRDAGRRRGGAATREVRGLAVVAERARACGRGGPPAGARRRSGGRVARPHRGTSPHGSGRGAHPPRGADPGRPRRRGCDHGRAPRERGAVTGGRPVSAQPPPSPLDPIEVAAASLVCLPDMTAARMRALLDRWDGPVGALHAVRRGLATVTLLARVRPDHVAERVTLARLWQAEVGNDRVLRTFTDRHTRVFISGREGFPIADDVPGRPSVLLAEGDDPAVLTRPRVAIVGTRVATPHGLADARETGAVLAEAGVTVVSGMAIGIDGAAHQGALDAGGGAVGVLATGLDVVYPRRHGALFRRVRASGLLVSELGYGVQPRPGAFPVRNRIIALLADVVVVIEATLRGGARITAERALEYGRPVLAVPGSRRNPAAEGTNALIADGAHPLLHPSDVLLAIGLTPGSRRPTRPAPKPGSDAARVLAACGGESATFDQLASRTGLGADQVAVAVRELERSGWMERAQGLCWPTAGEQ